MGSGSMVGSDPSQSFGITSLLFSGYTISLSGRVSREQRGGAAETDRMYASSGGIRTYLHLFECRDNT